MMRILYTAMKYDYGRQEQGLSFEHCNFYDALVHMGHDIVYFDFMTLLREHGKDAMNRRLTEVAKAEKPDLLFSVLFKDELDPRVLRKVADDHGVTTLNWFCDDHWRFDDFSRRWAPCFTWVVTTAASALPKYASLGYCNVIKSQWGCNHFLYRKSDKALCYDVTFVGQPHGNRRQVIHALRSAGINVRVWGNGWESGRISQADMIGVFGQSRINLNLANASVPVAGSWEASADVPVDSGALFRSRVSRVLNAVPFGSRVKAIGKRWRNQSAAIGSATAVAGTIDVPRATYAEQIKGRNFEVPGCGGFLLTGQADNLDHYYDGRREVVCFHDIDDMIEKVRYYLAHEEERAMIAQAGYERTLREHTYVHRFDDVFRQMELPTSSCRTENGQHVHTPGRTEEVK